MAQRTSGHRATSVKIDRERGIFCNRTLNLRSIRAIGYDMDYTLVHYRVEEWERRAYEYLKAKLRDLKWPVQDLRFDPDLVIRGLVLDVESGNTLKANRFGYIKRAYHGTRKLEHQELRAQYGGTLVDLSEKRWVFLNTFFSVSEASMFAQLVDLLDAGELPGVLGYFDLYRRCRSSIDEAHMEGRLKAEIIADPDRFIELDPDTPLTLLDQLHAGKKLVLITNSEWYYTRMMMDYAFNEYLPGEMTWRDLFEVVIVASRKPSFFTSSSPLFRVVNEEGLLETCPLGLKSPGIYLGGSASLVEDYLGLSGDEILYVGDHIFTDVHVSKNILQWRTALVLRELESDLSEMAAFEDQQKHLSRLMIQKERLEFQSSRLRLDIQRKRRAYGPTRKTSIKQLDERVSQMRNKLTALDEQIAPLATAAATIGNSRWGPLMRAGNDKSHLARQVERYADIYLSRVSNFLYHTPFVYLRAPRGSLPHDPDGVPLVSE